MELTRQQIVDGFRDGSLALCLPVMHENFRADFLEEFAARILHRDWREVCDLYRVPCLLVDDESEEDIVAAIETVYGVDVSDLPGLPFWEVVRRCEQSGRSSAHSDFWIDED
jgi:hypothetical protein